MLTTVRAKQINVSELDLDLVKRDTDFIVIAKKFLQNLTCVKDILPRPQGICMDNQDVVSVGSTCDGGIPGFRAIGYVICEDTVTKERTSKLACS